MKPHLPITLYRHPLSGHSHRVQLALSLLALPHTLVDVNLMQGEHKQPAFLALNPFGQVPVIDDGGQVVFDSNAILVYLATRYDADRTWLPQDPLTQARVQVWLSVAAGLIASGTAAARLVTVFGAKLDAEQAIRRALQLLMVMESELKQRSFLAGPSATLADIAGYSYIAAAPEGNVDLSAYPHVGAWLRRIEVLPGFVGLAKSAVGLQAGGGDGGR